MFAYRLPKADQPIDAAEHASAKRLLPAGPFQYAAHPQGGTLLTWRDAAGKMAPLHDYAAPRETADGLVYYGPKVLPTVADLVRRGSPPSIDVELSSGVVVPIALAASSPRKLVFTPTGASEGDYLTEYARLADDLREQVKRDGDVMRSDRLLHRVVLLAFQQSLRVTEELLTDLGWVSTADFLPIVMAAWGTDPKAGGTDDEPSLSPVPA